MMILEKFLNKSTTSPQRWMHAITKACVLLILSRDATAAQFYFNQDRPDAGTVVRRAIGYSNIPLDKTYTDLSDVSLKSIRELFPHLKEQDEPPFPAKSLRSLISLASNFRYQTEDTSRVSVILKVDETGTVRMISIVESNNSKLSSDVALLLTAVKFRPGRCDGQPCAMDFPFAIEIEGAGRIKRQAQ